MFDMFESFESFCMFFFTLLGIIILCVLYEHKLAVIIGRGIEYVKDKQKAKVHRRYSR